MTTAAKSQCSIGIWVFSLLAGVFGLLTIKSGGSVLFFDDEARQAAGHYVPFVLWLYFFPGVVYVVTAIAIWLIRPWAAAWLSLLLAASTLVIFAVLSQYIFNGGEYEKRTLAAMALQSGVWVTIAAFTWRRFLQSHE